MKEEQRQSAVGEEGSVQPQGDQAEGVSSWVGAQQCLVKATGGADGLGHLDIRALEAGTARVQPTPNTHCFLWVSCVTWPPEQVE